MLADRLKFLGMVGALACVALLGLPEIAHAAPYHEEHLSPYRPGPAPGGFIGICDRYVWACRTAPADTLPSTAALPIAEIVNNTVNAHVEPADDYVQYGVKEYWVVPTKRGDCEDFALLKMRGLIRAGVPSKDLLLAVVVGRNDEPHVVLVLRTVEADYVLDNIRRGVQSWKKSGYTFIKMQNASDRARWDIILLGPRALRG